MIEKIIGSTIKTINAKDKIQVPLKESYVYNSIYFNMDLDNSLTLNPDTLNNIELGIYAGTKDKSFLLGTLLDVMVASYIQNNRNIIDATNKKVKTLLNYDYEHDDLNTAIYPYLLPDCQIEIYNKLGKDLKAKIGYIGIDTTDYIDYIKMQVGGKLTEDQIKAHLNASINKRIFTGRGETLTASEQTFSISSASGWYDRLIVYTTSGNIEEIELQALQTIVERNDMETLSDLSFLRNKLAPQNAPVSQIAIVEGIPANYNLSLTVKGSANTKFRIITERVV